MWTWYIAEGSPGSVFRCDVGWRCQEHWAVVASTVVRLLLSYHHFVHDNWIVSFLLATVACRVHIKHIPVGRGCISDSQQTILQAALHHSAMLVVGWHLQIKRGRIWLTLNEASAMTLLSKQLILVKMKRGSGRDKFREAQSCQRSRLGGLFSSGRRCSHKFPYWVNCNIRTNISIIVFSNMCVYKIALRAPLAPAVYR